MSGKSKGRMSLEQNCEPVRLPKLNYFLKCKTNQNEIRGVNNWLCGDTWISSSH